MENLTLKLVTLHCQSCKHTYQGEYVLATDKPFNTKCEYCGKSSGVKVFNS